MINKNNIINTEYEFLDFLEKLSTSSNIEFNRDIVEPFNIKSFETIANRLVNC